MKGFFSDKPERKACPLCKDGLAASCQDLSVCSLERVKLEAQQEVSAILEKAKSMRSSTSKIPAPVQP